MVSKEKDRLWTDLELRGAVEAYLFLLRLQLAGIEYSPARITPYLQSGPLKNRNEASIRYRMRNISHVMRNLQMPTVIAYSPAFRVGSGVSRRIEDILKPRLKEEAILSWKKSGNREAPEQRRIDALKKLDELYDALSGSNSSNGLIGMGHNRPPELPEFDDNKILPDSHGIIEVKRDIEAIKKELNASTPNTKEIKKKENQLVKFGVALASWVGGRLTKGVDAVISSAITLTVAQATHVLPLIVHAIEAVAKYVGNLH